jgi:ABC-type Fe3+-hydroxamate transport system substrate-binding protein
MIEITDATGRLVKVKAPLRRVVSLVPSETASVAALVGTTRLVGRTDFCVEPPGLVDEIPSVGGTKGFDVEAVKALKPDLVLANKEENARPLVQALMDAGLTVHVSFPCTVEESLAYLETLCLLLGIDADEAEPLTACRSAIERARGVVHAEPVPIFVPIWRDPWMTFDDGVYASDVLRLCGAHNVFAGRSRRYPLAADLGDATAWTAERVQQRDTRYPRIRLEEVVERGACAVLLPDEPYAFGEDDAQMLGNLRSPRPLPVQLVDGKDLFWYGTQLARALGRLPEQIAALRASCFGSQAHK